MLALENRLANHNVGQGERPTIKGESDSGERGRRARRRGPRKGKHYDPKNDSMRLHGELGAFNPLKPLDRGEQLPAVEAYPKFDPYSKDGLGVQRLGAQQQRPVRKLSKDKKKKKDKKKDKKDKPDDGGAANGSTKEKKTKREEEKNRERQ